jgi:recombination protein RecR
MLHQSRSRHRSIDWPKHSPVQSSSAKTETLSNAYTTPVQLLIDELGRLPGIGPKSAQRIAFHLLKIPVEDTTRLAFAINDAKEKVRFCARCFNIADAELCPICADDRRDSSTICVVEESRDIVAIERTGEFRGRYHVLLGAMSPLEGIGPEQLKIRELLSRLEPEGVQEVIVCTNPNTEGEVTAMYLARALKPLGLKVTRIASGLPVGGDLEYADELTLGRALEGRRAMES